MNLFTFLKKIFFSNLILNFQEVQWRNNENLSQKENKEQQTQEEKRKDEILASRKFLKWYGDNLVKWAKKITDDPKFENDDEDKKEIWNVKNTLLRIQTEYKNYWEELQKLDSPNDKEFKNLDNDKNNKIKDFLKKNSRYDSPEYSEVIRQSFKQWLNPEETKIILDSSYEKIWSFQESILRKFLEIIGLLKENWNLDFYDWEWNIDDVNQVMNVLNSNVSDKFKKWILKKFYSWKLPEWIDLEPASLKKIVDIWLSQIWVNELDGWADKYFSEAWFWKINSKKVPWCAAFMNWVLKKSWFSWTNSLAAKSFINGSWYWHVWIKVWDKLLWGNQWNKVSLWKIPAKIEWFAIPTKTWLKIIKWDIAKNKIPDWAIIVTSRNPKTRQYS